MIKTTAVPAAPAAYRLKQVLCLGVGEHRRRLVEDENPGAADENLDDFDLLLLGDGQRVHAAVGIERKAEFGRLPL